MCQPGPAHQWDPWSREGGGPVSTFFQRFLACKHTSFAGRAALTKPLRIGKRQTLVRKNCWGPVNATCPRPVTSSWRRVAPVGEAPVRRLVCSQGPAGVKVPPPGKSHSRGGHHIPCPPPEAATEQISERKPLFREVDHSSDFRMGWAFPKALLRMCWRVERKTKCMPSMQFWVVAGGRLHLWITPRHRT